MIVIISIICLIGLMFWQPQMSSRDSPTHPIRKTKLERYIRHINRLIDEENYGLAIELIVRSKYPRSELPIDYWNEIIGSQLECAVNESAKVEILKNLKAILDS